MQRAKIITIAHKFADEESKFLITSDQTAYIRNLTVIWGAKEAIFKVQNEVGISFKDHIHLSPFTIKSKKGRALLNLGSLHLQYDIFFEEIENYMLVYAFQQ
jgi:phosphopantetheinyl transferase (holo-ACP synthase)